MAVPKRHATIPGTYFVSSRTWEGRSLFNATPPCEIFVEALLHYRDQGAYNLHAFVLMPDHFHLLLTPGEEATLERAVQLVKGGSAKRIRDALLFTFPVWQRGYSDHRIRDGADLENHLRYLMENPVKRKLALRAEEYRWSSGYGAYRMDDIPQRLKPPVSPGRAGTVETVP